MPSSKSSYGPPWSVSCTVVREEQIGILVDMLLTGFDSKYLNTLKAGEGLSEAAIREGYTGFKREKDSNAQGQRPHQTQHQPFGHGSV